jgi:hypothetical protein
VAAPRVDVAPVVSRGTLTPMLRRGDDDPALANQPSSATPPTPRPEPVPVSRRPDPRLYLLAGTVALLVVVLFAVWGALWARAPSTPAVATVAPEPSAPAPAPAPAPPRPELAPVVEPAVLTLRTDPPGASVWEEGQRLGSTPLEVLLEGGPDDPPRVFELRRPGFATHTVRQPWSERDVQHTVPLQVLPPAPDAPPEGLPQLREER